MGSVEVCNLKADNVSVGKQEKKLHLLLLEEGSRGEDPVVWEMDFDRLSLPGRPTSGAERLPSWLAAREICPCGPRRFAESEVLKKAEALARSNRELEQFAYVTSHDLQEPLRMVAAYSQLLAERYRGQLDEKADTYLSFLTEGALRMEGLIQDLLSLSRVDSVKAPATNVDGNAVFADVLKNLAAAIGESGALINCGTLPMLPVHRSHLAQLLQNLIANAIKFRQQKPPVVSVQAERTGPQWLFSVSDNGIGIPKEHVQMIFGVFRRLHGRSAYPGNGIGLAVCKKIAEHYGGSIWVESDAGGGSSFKFTLPAEGVPTD